jgi:hypothetical protein
MSEFTHVSPPAFVALFIGRGFIAVDAKRYTHLRTAVTGACFLSVARQKSAAESQVQNSRRGIAGAAMKSF